MEKNLEIEISKTNRGKEQIILNRKYKFNLSSKRKDNSKKYKCTEYKTLNQCPSFIILNNENQILEYDDSHNHLENKFGAAKSIVKNKIKDEISKSSIPFNVNIKRTYDEISQGMGLICPGYNSIKSQVTRSRRKQLPPDITSFDEIPNESKYYKTKRDENFMIFKNNDLIVFQSPFQAELFSKNKHIFADVFITRTYVTELNCFYTTSFSILKNKKQTTYEILFEEIKKNSSKYNSIEITPKIFHCDFEKAVSNAAQKVFINANIKYCIWHFKRALEIKKKELCGDKVEKIKDLYIYYNNISNFPFINPEYIYDIYSKIKSECQEHNYVQFLEFLEYFKKTYLINYETENWNYYDNIEHITNNVSETFNKYLKKLFAKKPTFFQLLSELQKEESKYYIDYERRTAKILRNKKQKKLIRTEEIKALVKYYKNMEILLKKKESVRNDFIDLWLKCLNDLNIKIID
ncbi:hypothetical protein H8356DRAFT_1418532 [Neocallimastix lanati (nom. inval.)]|uniref:MULE transposase domain-containing protein n=1 Tax=Neocallimastix californiae TaxID=1754190 RepID=A0A1Y2BJ76_9FUNG|nr:hypothetical protein H8356DRAFT_1418532 [Neocallimastix sp. JGI-2020a]ORY34165.1 hypothetical protein LY90DRAFT_511936 [Neocallimastix californiae]|eukprot:ORY34165.1 hypothetical protein LY90DRAFT_511936 [Neocallimastix californiae]